MFRVLQQLTSFTTKPLRQTVVQDNNRTSSMTFSSNPHRQPAFTGKKKNVFEVAFRNDRMLQLLQDEVCNRSKTPTFKGGIKVHSSLKRLATKTKSSFLHITKRVSLLAKPQSEGNKDLPRNVSSNAGSSVENIDSKSSRSGEKNVSFEDVELTKKQVESLLVPIEVTGSQVAPVNMEDVSSVSEQEEDLAYDDTPRRVKSKMPNEEEKPTVPPGHVARLRKVIAPLFAYDQEHL